ncbi:MBL fold metallo-hydrolase [Cohnella sp. CIP 111063]|uniref:MBL fold metallo-hydrolase n=1 Tax=unclassified Cohnella TaxID=2636738 RepID=UPI000B8C55F6|nr:MULTISPECIES: MBL fold metallo-hydrolase [unclassified Cohnella]OXS54198.1 MBL fold metallo-hydrolase [Cohnella sp. CIP 111063]PRX63383.1 L-ascorbate metabolism protein UlaG (beta-lactamase superfamily) [Cohnella sp. SGD-V74]
MARQRYFNTDPAAIPKTFKEVRRWQKERKGKIKDLSFRVGQAEHKRPSLLGSNRSELTITWIGHSTFLVQIGGLTIVTDPVWANRMGFARRLEEPGLGLDEIPPVDVILLSHSHYDHLHTGSLKRLKGSPVVLVPEGLGGMVRKLRRGSQVQELPWWGHVSIGSVEFHFVPSQHWTRRTLTDTNTSLWGGWVIKRTAASVANDDPKDESIYFAGDSGYFSGFRDIGAKFPNMTYALMPIGAYEPEWFMGTQHVTPEEAVQAFLDVGAKRFIPMHYGAFRLADDTTKEALDRLLAEWERRALDRDRLRLFKHGETLVHVAEREDEGSS